MVSLLQRSFLLVILILNCFCQRISWLNRIHQNFEEAMRQLALSPVRYEAPEELGVGTWDHQGTGCCLGEPQQRHHSIVGGISGLVICTLMLPLVLMS